MNDINISMCVIERIARDRPAVFFEEKGGWPALRYTRFFPD